MKFTVGDRILLKRTGEEGHVIAIIDKLMLEVEVGGTNFPVYMDDVDHPYLKWFTEKKLKKKSEFLPDVPVEKVIERKQRLARGIYFSFIPVFKLEGMEEQVDFLKVHLLNELPVDIRFSYDLRLEQKSIFKHEGLLHPFGNIYIHNILYADMNDQPRFHWYFMDIQNEQMEAATGILRIKPAKLFAQVNEIMFNGGASFSYQLIDDFVAKKKPGHNDLPVPDNTPAAIGIVTKYTLEQPKYELDLHIEQLVANPGALSSAEIIAKQLEMLERYLYVAIVHRQERMIVIHGLGKGKLKDEVHIMLKNTPEVSRYKNEWSGKYGFGATEVLFKYK
jgi:hypothetical protein